MNDPMRILPWRVLLSAAAAAFVLFLGWAVTTLDTAAFGQLTDDPWVKVVLADFYLGILCFTALVHAVERKLLLAIIWGAAAAFLGYPVVALWLVLRGLPGIERLRATP